jgi:hypothetical protein
MHLFRGAHGAFRNPASHRDLDSTTRSRPPRSCSWPTSWCGSPIGPLLGWCRRRRGAGAEYAPSTTDERSWALGMRRGRPE